MAEAAHDVASPGQTWEAGQCLSIVERSGIPS